LPVGTCDCESHVPPALAFLRANMLKSKRAREQSWIVADIINVSGLGKVFHLGLRRKRVEAVTSIDFSVPERSIFGFLGPNGAGKTTTIKMLTGLIRPTRGRASIFGVEVPKLESRARFGFLPENPYIFPYLTPFEFVEMTGRLSGLRGSRLRDRVRQVLAKTGVLYAADRPARRLSKGMLQRTGLAAALVADPELLILDEPMSGLDPVGRKEVKDLIVEERSAGRTVFFSTHILGDVETMCDEVVILRRGAIVVKGKLDELLRRDTQRIGVVLSGAGPDLVEFCRERRYQLDEQAGRLRIEVRGTGERDALLKMAFERGAEIEEVVLRHETLEELFVREAIQPQAAT
jgi:ABC-2 type transport system ATP-binding protein